MNKLPVIIAAAALFCAGFGITNAHATDRAGDMPTTKAEKSLSDFLPAQGEEGRPSARHHEKGEHMKRDGDRKGDRKLDKEARKEHWEEKRKHMMERIESLPPEEQEAAMKRLEDMKSKREAVKAELEALPPEEREARMEEMRAEWKGKREGRREEFKEKFQERWDSSSEEERAEFCTNARERCAEDGKRACEFAKKSCGGAE